MSDNTRKELTELLDSPVHAPANTHSAYDGSCSGCPWPLSYLPPGDIADAILARYDLTPKEPA